MTLQRRAALDPSTPRTPIPAAPLDVEAFTIALVQWYLEFRAGRRTVEQLRPYVSAPLLGRLERRAGDRLPAPELRAVTRTLVQRRDAHTFSMVALVRRGERTSAIAIQLRQVGPRWLVTELTAPEDGVRPTGDVSRRAEPADDENHADDHGLDGRDPLPWAA